MITTRRAGSMLSVDRGTGAGYPARAGRRGQGNDHGGGRGQDHQGRGRGPPRSGEQQHVDLHREQDQGGRGQGHRQGPLPRAPARSGSNSDS